ncbi:hypothetical protein GQ44DRAFT_681550, partial [Phaeosphaeriaceae sp. PMI808]
MSFVPVEHPLIPDEVNYEDLIAIVTIHHVQAPDANRETPYHKTPFIHNGNHVSTRRSVTGTNVFLRSINGQQSFCLGRFMTPDSKAKRELQDVYIPGSSVGMRQFTMLPVWESNSWRLQTHSEYIASVNGAPIQVYNARTKKTNHVPLPQAIHLKQLEVNHIELHGLRVDIWLMKSVHELYGPHDITSVPLEATIQDVTRRSEDWARDRYQMTQEPVSTRTFRVLERFTGKKFTAKVFRGERQEQHRNREFLMFSKQETDASIVRYLESTEINGIPAVITTYHDGFLSYTDLQHDILRLHPGIRFEMAGKLLRRLFSALGFLHFHRITHGNVSKDSVLLRIANERLDHMLLVNYSTARPTVPGAPVPLIDMNSDGKSAMELIEKFCDLWALRSGPTKDASSEEIMQERTLEAIDEYRTVKRVAADYFETQGQSKKSTQGKKLMRLLDLKAEDWHSARNKQVRNARSREVADVSHAKLDMEIKEWESEHPRPSGIISQKQYMILSLGHPYLDSLVDQLHHNRWDTTPQEVCTKIKEVSGDIEEPWQTFEVQKDTFIASTEAGYAQEAILAWLATCCEIYPEWRHALEVESEKHVRRNTQSVGRLDIRDLHSALPKYGQLPCSVEAGFQNLIQMKDNEHVLKETFKIWYHIPSRMFNLTQLQRLSDPGRFISTVKEGKVTCENFVEVRGEPKIQGCYAPLSLLGDFISQFGLTLSKAPELKTTLPQYDPSDFSQVSPGRIVLARLGLLGYGSMTCLGDQCNFLNKKNHHVLGTKQDATATYLESGIFLPTNFGDMKVLPTRPVYAQKHERPEHWAKFKTAEEIEAVLNSSKRKSL